MTAITKNQITIIKIRQKEIGLDDETYRDFLEGLTGKRSCTELDFDEARKVISELAKRTVLRRAQDDKQAQDDKREPAVRRPSDGGAVITEEQQELIKEFRRYLRWDEKKMQVQAKKIVKVWWPQTRAQGVALIINLIAISADQMLRNIEFLDKSKLTDWERGFLYFNQPNALEGFTRYAANKNKRGSRTMPDCSILKLLEILMTRPVKAQILRDTPSGQEGKG